MLEIMINQKPQETSREEMSHRDQMIADSPGAIHEVDDNHLKTDSQRLKNKISQYIQHVCACERRNETDKRILYILVNTID